MDRRKFIHQLGMGTTSMILPSTSISFMPVTSPKRNAEPLIMGIVADIHKDLMPDADERLSVFIAEAQRRKADFIIQLGDFCMADSKNLDFMGIWETFKGPKYHVLGNHDMDKNSKKRNA